MLYTIVIPCYRSAQTIRKVVELTMQEMERLNRKDYEFVLVDDCSPDGGATVAALLSLTRDYPCVRAVELAKNAGQHNAVLAGLNEGRGDYFIAMDDDMQTHPSQLGALLAESDKGHDIVYGYYREKKESRFRNFGSWVNYMTVRILLKKPKEMKTSSFWVIKRFVRDYAVEYKSAYTHLQGLFLRTTRDIVSVPIQHFEREAGTSGYTLKKLVKLWSNILGFSIVPLQLATYTGFFFAVLGIFAAIGVVILKLVRPSTYIGWPSMMATICFFSGLNLMFMGIIGEYVGRIFLGMSNNPQYVVRAVHGGEAEAKKPAAVPRRVPETERPADTRQSKAEAKKPAAVPQSVPESERPAGARQSKVGGKEAGGCTAKRTGAGETGGCTAEYKKRCGEHR